MTLIATSGNRSIPSLDGLRAVSILLVIAAHARWYLPHLIQTNTIFRLVVGNGVHGVAVFFVISGYLITTLLLKELEATGDISLRKFYLRRSLRIFPPYYAFLLVMALLSAAKIIPQDPKSLLTAATYTWSLNPHAIGYCLFHSWSLSIEELFYLFWPALMLWAYRRNQAPAIAAALIVSAPVVRVGLYFVAPTLRGHEGFMIQGWTDTLMLGCMLALLERDRRWHAWRERLIHSGSAAMMAVLGFFAVPLVQEALPKRLGTLFYLSASFTITAICISGMVMYLVNHPDSFAGRVMNCRLLRHIGVISYSLYLWQQVFLWERIDWMPLGLLCILACAEASYWCIERPALRLRDWMQADRSIPRAGRESLDLKLMDPEVAAVAEATLVS